MNDQVDRNVRALAERLLPGCHVERIVALAPDTGGADTHKAAGYGAPRRIDLRGPDGVRSIVLHVATSNPFGHDRRADRAEEQLLAFDTFGLIPRHVRALDVGAIGRDGELVSLRDAGELYLVTTWASGSVYADDLRRIAGEGRLGPGDLERCTRLASYLAELHATPEVAADERDRAAAYRRAIRDLVGHGEGIFGMVDGYHAGTAAASAERLYAIERECLAWRWRLRDRHQRLRRTHGDFHPFNVVFSDGTDFTLLDASRGCRGDGADDVAAMAINYVFFAADAPAAWPALRTLLFAFFETYVARSGDEELFDVIAPFLAWRGLVVASPAFYPDLPAVARDRVLRLCERVLAAPRMDPAFADELFT